MQKEFQQVGSRMDLSSAIGYMHKPSTTSMMQKPVRHSSSLVQLVYQLVYQLCKPQLGT